MPASGWRAGDFDPGLFDVIGCAAGVLGLARRAAWLMAAAQRSGAAPGQRGCAGPEGPRVLGWFRRDPGRLVARAAGPAWPAARREGRPR